jgi:predicted transglutaminase-like cysteine proteinase
MRNRFVAATFALLILAFGLGLGCAGTTGGGVAMHYTWFTLPAPDDAWSPKIAGWQRRERADSHFVADVPGVAGGPALADESPVSAEAETPSLAPQGDLRTKYSRFRAERKRQMAAEVASWIQSQAKAHYVEDGPIDHWATLEETLRSDGDDCDGLELLTFHALRDLGFGENEVYRAVVFRPSDGQHHMVTLWFEDRNDPWVIDPTGAMTLGMPRMSDMPAWVPLKVFSDTVEYTVRPGMSMGIASGLAAND